MPISSRPADLPHHPVQLKLLGAPPLLVSIAMVQAANPKATRWLGLDLFEMRNDVFAPAVRDDVARGLWLATAKQLSKNGAPVAPYTQAVVEALDQGLIRLHEPAAAAYLTDRGVQVIVQAAKRLPPTLQLARIPVLTTINAVVKEGLDSQCGHSEAIRRALRILAAMESVVPGKTWVGLDFLALQRGQVVPALPLDKGQAAKMERLVKIILSEGMTPQALAETIRELNSRRLTETIEGVTFLAKLGLTYLEGSISRQRRRRH